MLAFSLSPNEHRKREARLGANEILRASKREARLGASEKLQPPSAKRA